MNDYKLIPELIENFIDFPKPNHTMEMFIGDFELRNHECSIGVNGKIYFSWFPEYGNYFTGTFLFGDFDKYISNPVDYFDIYIDEKKISTALIIKCITSLPSTNLFLKGVLTDKIFFGDKDLKIEVINFSIPNLRSINGNVVRDKKKSIKARILLENDLWRIEIDKKSNYHELRDQLLIVGGYDLLYSGKITRLDGTHFDTGMVEDIFMNLDLFLSFINGRNTSSLFLNGIKQNEIVWSDYTSKTVDVFEDNFYPIFERNVDGINLMWKEFSKICQSKKGQIFIKNILHWYIQSKKQAGLLDGSIIMAQTGLEILYHYITDNKEDLNKTPSKLRKLLIYLEVNDKEIPLKSKEMINFSTNFLDKKYQGIIGTITTVRNDLIHSKEKFIDIISFQLKFEVYNINLWLIEISLLKI
ncbi:hypothetical protein [Flavobacterium muglaense]|uniref:YopA central domain-containing protein n=1 Tax=Flavobacterium muglaense TaxID=2764716 RepID=A0A923N226_9FLAO|nr:hypothetical protein [Flavobacterium muglaense]MBC5838056.1 hypothetical protein [Flavobacterium muglaense]MBC5844640.1 hypothetical protein [Flavobacterium muglaense]